MPEPDTLVDLHVGDLRLTKAVRDAIVAHFYERASDTCHGDNFSFQDFITEVLSEAAGL